MHVEEPGRENNTGIYVASAAIATGWNVSRHRVSLFSFGGIVTKTVFEFLDF